MHVRVHIFLLLLITCELSNIHVDGECTYPPQLVANTYYDNEKGLVTFTRDTMTGWPVTLTSIQSTVTSWECYRRNGSIIVSKNKQAITMYGITFYAFVCMVVDLKDSYFFYKLWSAKEANADEERVSIKTNAQADLCEICNKKYIADDFEIKYMCTVETCGQVDKTKYTAPVTVCSDQPVPQTEISVETTTFKSSSSSSTSSTSSSSSSINTSTSSSSTSLETSIEMLASTTIDATIPITVEATTTTTDENITAGLSERTTQEVQTSLNGIELKTDTSTSITATPSDEHPTSSSSSVDFSTNQTSNSISTIQTTTSSSTSSRFSTVNEITTTSKLASLIPPTTTMLTSVTKHAISSTEEPTLSIVPTTHSSSTTKTSTAASFSRTSTPQREISAIFTSEALMTSIVLCVLVLFMVLISIVISMKIRKRKYLPPRVSPKNSHPLHIKPMYHDNNDFF